MKNAIKFLLLLVLIMSGNHVSASSTFINNNGIRISDSEYNNLINLGFTNTEINNMNQKEFDLNKNLNGTVVSREFINTQPTGMMRTSSSGYVSTASKRVTISIISINNYYRFKVTTEWYSFPSTRSYDILGIGIDTNVKINSSLYFQINYCFTSGVCESNNVFTRKISTTGGTAIYKLPSGSLSSMSSYLYFDIAKNTSSTITQLKAYGDYAHATQNISLTNAKKHSINRGGIILENSISGYYDNMTTAVASLSTNW